MAGIFQEVGLTWKGEEHVVPADQVMGLIEVIEDIVTIEELSGRGVKRSKVARAFSAALRYAGVKAKSLGTKIDSDGRPYTAYDLDEDVFATLFGDDAMGATTSTVYALLSLMIPPERLQTKVAPGKPLAPRGRKRGAKGS